MMSRKFVKILCIVLAVLMALSAVAVIVPTVFAADANQIVLSSPVTGDNDMDTIIPVAIAVVAVVVIVVCLVMPKLKKKDDETEEDY